MAGLEEITVYRTALALGESVWNIVADWDDFSRRTLGRQAVRAADSIAANISEGFGRFYFKENRQFCFYARGSLFELKTWMDKALSRQLITDTQRKELETILDELGKTLNGYIKSIGRSSPSQ